MDKRPEKSSEYLKRVMSGLGFGTGANATPLTAGEGSSKSLGGDPAADSVLPIQAKEQKLGACKKCGYTGHLTFQCRNFIRLEQAKEVVLDVSSTSSDSDSDYNTPLTDLRSAELKARLQKKKSKKEKKSKKAKKRRRRHSSSSSESDSDDDSDSDDRRKSKKRKKSKKKKHKKDKKRKQSKRRRSSSSSSSSS